MNVKHAWRIHKRKWKDCTACPLGGRAKYHVLGRGSLPADVLFLGEAPGKTENLTGKPFVGRAGAILDAAIEDVGASFSYFITNPVACRPCDSAADPNRQPRWEEVTACQGRVFEVLEMASPKLVVAMGRIAATWVQMHLINCSDFMRNDPPLAFVDHPAYIARQGGVKYHEGTEPLTPYEKFVGGIKEPIGKCVLNPSGP